MKATGRQKKAQDKEVKKWLQKVIGPKVVEEPKEEPTDNVIMTDETPQANSKTVTQNDTTEAQQEDESTMPIPGEKIEKVVNSRNILETGVDDSIQRKTVLNRSTCSITSPKAVATSKKGVNNGFKNKKVRKAKGTEEETKEPAVPVSAAKRKRKQNIKSSTLKSQSPKEMREEESRRSGDKRKNYVKDIDQIRVKCVCSPPEKRCDLKAYIETEINAEKETFLNEKKAEPLLSFKRIAKIYSWNFRDNNVHELLVKGVNTGESNLEEKGNYLPLNVWLQLLCPCGNTDDDTLNELAVRLEHFKNPIRVYHKGSFVLCSVCYRRSNSIRTTHKLEKKCNKITAQGIEIPHFKLEFKHHVCPICRFKQIERKTMIRHLYCHHESDLTLFGYSKKILFKHSGWEKEDQHLEDIKHSEPFVGVPHNVTEVLQAEIEHVDKNFMSAFMKEQLQVQMGVNTGTTATGEPQIQESLDRASKLSTKQLKPWLVSYLDKLKEELTDYPVEIELEDKAWLDYCPDDYANVLVGSHENNVVIHYSFFCLKAIPRASIAIRNGIRAFQKLYKTDPIAAANYQTKSIRFDEELSYFEIKLNAEHPITVACSTLQDYREETMKTGIIKSFQSQVVVFQNLLRTDAVYFNDIWRPVHWVLTVDKKDNFTFLFTGLHTATIYEGYSFWLLRRTFYLLPDFYPETHYQDEKALCIFEYGSLLSMPLVLTILRCQRQIHSRVFCDNLGQEHLKINRDWGKKAIVIVMVNREISTWWADNVTQETESIWNPERNFLQQQLGSGLRMVSQVFLPKNQDMGTLVQDFWPRLKEVSENQVAFFDFKQPCQHPQFNQQDLNFNVQLQVTDVPPIADKSDKAVYVHKSLWNQFTVGFDYTVKPSQMLIKEQGKTDEQIKDLMKEQNWKVRHHETRFWGPIDI